MEKESLGSPFLFYKLLFYKFYIMKDLLMFFLPTHSYHYVASDPYNTVVESGVYTSFQWISKRFIFNKITEELQRKNAEINIISFQRV